MILFRTIKVFKNAGCFNKIYDFVFHSGSAVWKNWSIGLILRSNCFFCLVILTAIIKQNKNYASDFSYLPKYTVLMKILLIFFINITVVLAFSTRMTTTIELNFSFLNNNWFWQVEKTGFGGANTVSYQIQEIVFKVFKYFLIISAVNIVK